MEMSEVKQLTDRVYLIPGLNPSMMTLEGTNTYLIGTGSTRLLIDTGEGRPDYIQTLLQSLTSLNISLEGVLLTHYHMDHIGGAPDLNKNFPKLKFHKFILNPEEKLRIEQKYSIELIDIQDGDIFRTEGCTVRVIHAPGHTDDSVCFYLEEENALFTGDLILGKGSTILSDYVKYLDSMNKLKIVNSAVMYPGHGPVCHNTHQKIEEQLGNRYRREMQVLDVLNKTEEGYSISELVEVIYEDIDVKLVQFASMNTRQYLEKLKTEDKVRQQDSKWFLNPEFKL